MSRAFVKETDDNPTIEEIPDRPISPFPNLVTAEGLAAMDAEIARLKGEHAAAEKAEDRPALLRAARDLRYWTTRHATAELVEPIRDTTHVRFGATVTVKRDDGRKLTWRIVGEDEADPSHGTLSHASPMAQALMGKEVGDVATVGEHEVKIAKIA